MKKLVIAVLMVVLGGLFFRLTGVSAEGENPEMRMTISPPNQKIVLVPGETFNGSIEVSNSNDSPSELKYSVTIGSYGLVRDENGVADYEDIDTDTVTGHNQMMDWIKLDKKSGTVKPNETDVVPFKIEVPNDAPAGGQYATIIVQNDTNDGQAEKGLNVQEVVRFAASISAEVAGETRKEGAILENNIPAFVFNNPLIASSTVQNSGNVHTDAKYVLQVWPLFSEEEICTNEEEPSESMIMPETERMHTEECNLPAFGIFRARQTVEIFGEKSVAEKTLLVCPLWLLFIVIFAIVALVIWIVTRVKGKKPQKAAAN